MRSLLRIAVTGLFVASASAATPVHFSVTRSAPAKDAKLEGAPKRLQIWFSQAPAAGVSEVKLKREAADVALEKTVVQAAEKSIYADPVKPLETGAYVLAWRAAGDDGHVMSGEIKFAIVPKSER